MNIPLQRISDPALVPSGIHLFVLRLDRTHPHISGNKWFKLKYNLEEAKRQGKNTLLTFGGAYSNHIAAVAATGKEQGFNTIGIIRGDELKPKPISSLRGEAKFSMNPTLDFALKCGMNLHFVSRDEYRKIRKTNQYPITVLPNYYVLPEGGTNYLAVKGCAEILSLIDIPFDFVCCPIGTGGTLAGIICSLQGSQQALGFSALKGGEFLFEEIRNLLRPSNLAPNWDIIKEYHFGGYARHTSQLLKFISDFQKQNNIPLEQVYTAKMIFGIYQLIGKGYFKKGSTVIAVHTGGLQGKLDSSSYLRQGQRD